MLTLAVFTVFLLYLGCSSAGKSRNSEVSVNCPEVKCPGRGGKFSVIGGKSFRNLPREVVINTTPYQKLFVIDEEGPEPVVADANGAAIKANLLLTFYKNSSRFVKVGLKTQPIGGNNQSYFFTTGNFKIDPGTDDVVELKTVLTKVEQCCDSSPILMSAENEGSFRNVALFNNDHSMILKPGLNVAWTPADTSSGSNFVWRFFPETELTTIHTEDRSVITVNIEGRTGSGGTKGPTGPNGTPQPGSQTFLAFPSAGHPGEGRIESVAGLVTVGSSGGGGGGGNAEAPGSSCSVADDIRMKLHFATIRYSRNSQLDGVAIENSRSGNFFAVNVDDNFQLKLVVGSLTISDLLVMNPPGLSVSESPVDRRFFTRHPDTSTPGKFFLCSVHHQAACIAIVGYRPVLRLIPINGGQASPLPDFRSVSIHILRNSGLALFGTEGLTCPGDPEETPSPVNDGINTDPVPPPSHCPRGRQRRGRGPPRRKNCVNTDCPTGQQCQ